MQPKIRHMQALDTIVRLGSFVEASKVLHVTPAALSLAIRQLEDALGFALMERTTRRLKITEAGRGYLPFVQRVLSELESADRYAREIQQGHWVVRIATTQTIISTLLAAAIPEVHSRWPKIRLDPLDVAAKDIASALNDRRTDLAIGIHLPSNAHFAARMLFRSRWHAYVAPNHGLARRKRLGWAELAPLRLYMNGSSNLQLQSRLGPDVVLADVQDTTTASSGMAMALTGLGVAVFPGYAQPIARLNKLRAIPIETPSFLHELHIGRSLQPSTSAPLDEIQDIIVRALDDKCKRLV